MQFRLQAPLYCGLAVHEVLEPLPHDVHVDTVNCRHAPQGSRRFPGTAERRLPTSPNDRDVFRRAQETSLLIEDRIAMLEVTCGRGYAGSEPGRRGHLEVR